MNENNNLKNNSSAPRSIIVAESGDCCCCSSSSCCCFLVIIKKKIKMMSSSLVFFRLKLTSQASTHLLELIRMQPRNGNTIFQMTQTKFNVGMTCGGCANAVKRILNKMDGVTEVNADVEQKLVTVEHTDGVSAQEMLSALQKWADAAGKSLELRDD